MLGERGSRLVEDHYLRIKGEGACNGDHVALGDAQGFQGRMGIDLHFEASEDIPGFLVHGGPVELFQKALIEVLTDKNVLRYRQLIKQHGLLVDRRNAHPMGGFRRG